MRREGREIFRACFANFEYDKNAEFDENDKDCPCCLKINTVNPTVVKRRDHEVV